MQVFGIAVESIRSAVDRQVAGQMARQKTQKTQAGNRHHYFFADGCAKGCRQPVHCFAFLQPLCFGMGQVAASAGL
jgi:hypothetical protein